MADLVRVSELAGITLHYDRFTEEDYGQPGHPHAVYMTAELRDELNECIRDIVSRSPTNFGRMRYILTAGAFVQKPGFHGQGRAFDLDGLGWDEQSWVADTFPRKQHIYLAIESVVRKHFGTVLTYSYNAPHHDHMHIDDGTSPGFEPMAKSRVVFLQNALTFVHAIPVARDGVWGPETQTASKMLREELGIGGFSERANWMKFLDVTADRAFEAVVASMLTS